MTMRIRTSARNAAADGVVDECEVGSAEAAAVLELYSGSRPTNVGDTPTGDLLASFTLNDPAFGAAGASNPGEAIAAGLPLQTTGADDGTIGWFRVIDQDEDPVWDSDSVGVGTGELQVNTLTVAVGVDVEVTAWTVTMPDE